MFVGTAVLTMALLEEMHAHLDMWMILTGYRGQVILTAPSAVPTLRKQLCKLLKTIAYVPTDQYAIARLSTKPTDAMDVKLAEEPTTKASEPLLGLHHYWFWITAVCASGVSTGMAPQHTCNLLTMQLQPFFVLVCNTSVLRIKRSD